MSIFRTVLNMIQGARFFLQKKTLKRNLFSVSTAHCPDSNPYAIPSRTTIAYRN